MGASKLENVLITENQPKKLQHSAVYYAYLEAHPDDAGGRYAQQMPRHYGTAAFGSFMTASFGAVAYELLAQMHSVSPFGGVFAAGLAAFDAILGITGILTGKILWDYETSRCSNR